MGSELFRIYHCFIGIYTCVAKTQTTGTDTESGELKVEGIKPSIDGPKETYQVLPEGKEIRVLCKIDGDPKPEQTWFKVSQITVISINRQHLINKFKYKVLNHVIRYRYIYFFYFRILPDWNLSMGCRH